ncbi:MAG: SDR family oxidoreductase [Acidimicrobiia bacterium]|nr:SDR family oxidoreductase [Acidimicrobiia bacterium]
MQETAPQMIAQVPQEHIYKLVCVGSVASRKPLVHVTVYCTSKYGCLALTHCGAVALAEHNITVNGYAPRRRQDAALGTARQGRRGDRVQGAEGQAFEDLAEGKRPHPIYGPGRDQGLTSQPTVAIEHAVRRQPYAVEYGGVLDLQYAPDVARLFVAACRSTPDEAAVLKVAGPCAGVDMGDEVPVVETVLALQRAGCCGRRGSPGQASSKSPRPHGATSGTRVRFGHRWG